MMDAKTYNDIAAFLEKGHSQETEGSVEGILSEEDSRTLLTACLREAGAGLPVGSGPPLRVTAFVRLGCNEGFLRLFQMENFDLAGPSKRIAAVFKALTPSQLPLCLSKRLELEIPTIPEIGGLRLELNHDGFRLEVHPNLKPLHNAYLEIWQQGQLAHTFPIQSAPRAASTRLRLDRASLLHVAEKSYCAGLRVAPVEFTALDWISAALGCALSGDFGKAMDLLDKRVKGVLKAREASFNQVTGFFKGLIGCAHCENFMLLPASATRSATTNRERMKLALGVPWAGIETVWPAVKNLKSPWTPEGTVDADTVELPEPARALVKNLIQAFEAETAPEPSVEVAGDRALNEAWRSFQGWNALVGKRYDQALQYFAGLEGGEADDPFGIQLGSMLSSHLSGAIQRPEDTEENENSSERIWRFITEKLISSVEEK